MDVIGIKLRALRTARGLTLRELARGLGLSHGHLSDLETGRRTPTIKTLCHIARYYGVSPAYFLQEGDAGSVQIQKREAQNE